MTQQIEQLFQLFASDHPTTQLPQTQKLQIRIQLESVTDEFRCLRLLKQREIQVENPTNV